MSGYFFALLVAYGYASSNFYMKKGMETGSNDIGVYYTIIVNSIISLMLSIYIIGKNPSVLNFPGIIFFILSGIMGPLLGRLTLYTAVNHIGITFASSIKITAPVFAAMIAYLALGESLSIPAIMGMFIVMFGLYLLSNTNKANKKAGLNKAAFKIGISFALASALSFAVGNVFRKFGLQYIDSAVVGLAVSTNGSLIIYTIYYLIKGKLKEVIQIPPEAKKSFIIGGIFTTIGTFCYFLSLKTIPVAVTVTIANTEPIFVILLSRYIFKLEDEPLNFRLLVNIALIFTGVVVITFWG